MGEFTRGNGLQKKDVTESGFPCIHYGQIHTSYNTSAYSTISYCSKSLAKKLKKAKYGDLLIATTSEDVDACCKAIAWLGEGEVAYSGDSFKFSHNQNPKYIAYLFKTEAFSKQKRFQNKSVCVLQGQKSCEYLGLLWKSLSLVFLLSKSSRRLLTNSTLSKLLSPTSSRRLSCARSNTSTTERNFSHLNNS